MPIERDVAAELAALIRENRDELVDAYIGEYDRRYTHSRGLELPANMRASWIASVFDSAAADLAGDPDPHGFESCGGDMVVQCEKAFNPIAVYVESRLFLARFLAPYIWRHYQGSPLEVKRAFGCLEHATTAAIRANVESFLDRMERPDSLSSTWDFYGMPRSQAVMGDLENALREDASSNPGTPASSQAQTMDVLASGRDASACGTADSAGTTPLLTGREEDILHLVISGLSNKQIAARLGLGLSTVKNHMGHIFGKFGVQSRTELVAKVLQSKTE